ncbi:hypothetical protein LSM04_000694 [Trypanosoma melophagium]|uniref:uncharacterized protein n=1 Tax=Trypanosoma melophagium TaxID=715481 RepID=UPI003519DA60|nr:hypothetical protein LSM04_000694 [Trypanosoma melophagium]
MMIDSGSAKNESRWAAPWRSLKSYVSHVGSVYLSFAAPMALFFVFNMAMDTQDPERFGLAWLHYSGMEDEQEREAKFPAYEPGSAPQRKRVAAANATEYVAAVA